MTMTIPTIPVPTSSGPALRTRRSDLAAFPAALASERIKLMSLRANRVFLALAPLLGGLIAFALASAATKNPITASELFIFPLPLIATLATVTGILMFTAEAQHGTLAAALTARPTRWVIVAAKATTAILVGVFLGIAATAAAFGGAVLGGAEVGQTADIVPRGLWALLYIALSAVIGLGVGMIVRHSSGAISGLLMWSFVIESLFAPALPDDFVHFLPFSAGYRLLDAGPHFETPVAIAHELVRWEYAVIFGGYAALTLAIGTVLLYRRDTN